MSDRSSSDVEGGPPWSESTFDLIDRAIAEATTRPPPTHIPIASPVASTSAVTLEESASSLYDRFRDGRPLSVSDLVGPDWCEVQHTYGLLNKRNRPPSERMPEFTTDKGNVVKVNQNKIKSRAAVLAGGHAVHTTLEKEIMPETVTVETTTREDRSGLSLLNLLVTLQQLLTEGKAREVPIFGRLHGVGIRGVIDEIVRKELPGHRKTLKADLTPAANKIDSYFSPTKKKARGRPPKKPTHGYYLLDNKTRGTSSLPNEDSMTGPRHQIELYKWLFDQHAKGLYDWDAHWSKRGVDPDQTFSPAFLTSIREITEANALEIDIEPTTLNHLASALKAAFSRIGPLQSVVSLVFRLRDRATPTLKHHFMAGPGGHLRDRAREEKDIAKAIALSLGVSEDGPTAMNGDEQADLAKAIAASLADRPAMPSSTPVFATEVSDHANETPASPSAELLRSEAEALDEATIDAAEAVEPRRSADETGSVLVDRMSRPSSPEESSVDLLQHLAIAFAGKSTSALADDRIKRRKVDLAVAPSKTGPKPGDIIGQRLFAYDETALMSWLKGRMAYWQAAREPIGVSEDQTWKSCEFNDGCEWLAAKGEEAASMYRARRSHSLATPSLV